MKQKDKSGIGEAFTSALLMLSRLFASLRHWWAGESSQLAPAEGEENRVCCRFKEPELTEDEVAKINVEVNAYYEERCLDRLNYPNRHDIRCPAHLDYVPDELVDVDQLLPESQVPKHLIQEARKRKRKGKVKIANAEKILELVKKKLAAYPDATKDGDVRIAEFNALMANLSKAEWFEEAYREILKKTHVWTLAEINEAAAEHIASLLPNRVSYCTTANNREQAVAIIVDLNRLEVIGDVEEFLEFANVAGIESLRPALCIRLRDKVTGEEFEVASVHAKSMRGGVTQTAKVRVIQFMRLVQHLGRKFIGYVCGDFNYIISNKNADESKPFTDEGYQLAGGDDLKPTHIMGGVLDAFWRRGLDIIALAVVDFWEFERAFSDHALLLAAVKVSKGRQRAKPEKVLIRTSTGSEAGWKLRVSALTRFLQNWSHKK